MDDSFLEILLLAMVAAFLVYRLHNVLGRRTGNERRRPSPFGPRGAKDEANENVVQLPDRSDQAPPEDDIDDDSPIADGARAIRAADPSFTLAGFVDGASKAFEIVVNAYAAGDGKALRPLLSDDVFANFASSIRQRIEADQRQETTLVGIKSADIIEARMEGRRAHVTVKFVTEQINAVYDSDGNVIDGDPNQIAVVTDIWGFARDTRNRLRSADSE